MNSSTSKTIAKLPDFLIIGAFKAGTTSLARRLSEHPDIYMSKTKETHFFAKDDRYERGVDTYRDYFTGRTNESVAGEASPSYTRSKYNPHACERITSTLPEAKLIYILRDPILRIESHWVEGRRSGFDLPEFNKAVMRETGDMIDTSLYWKQLALYREKYSDDQILVLFLEDFAAQPEIELQRCYRFLGVDDTYVVANPGRVSRPSKGAYMDRALTPKLRRSWIGNTALKMTPSSVLNLIKPLMRTKIVEKPAWRQDTLALAQSEIRDDSACILEYAGKPPDFWAMNPSQLIAEKS